MCFCEGPIVHSLCLWPGTYSAIYYIPNTPIITNGWNKLNSTRKRLDLVEAETEFIIIPGCTEMLQPCKCISNNLVVIFIWIPG